MNADHSAQVRLLDLQAADTALAQLAHRRRTLPELATITERARQAGEVHNELVDAQTQAGDVAAEQRRLENEVDAVRSRAGRDEARLQAGGVPAKELEGLQHEITTLARRQSGLEDELLEVMERREEIEAQASVLTARQVEMQAELAELGERRDGVFAEIDAASTQRTAEREQIAGELPVDLVALYERARQQGGGVGAAMLRQRRCEGCHIELSGSELSAVRSAQADEIVRCENCRRILVRTSESGL